MKKQPLFCADVVAPRAPREGLVDVLDRDTVWKFRDPRVNVFNDALTRRWAAVRAVGVYHELASCARLPQFVED